MIERDGKRGSGKSVLAVWHDDDDEEKEEEDDEEEESIGSIINNFD